MNFSGNRSYRSYRSSVRSVKMLTLLGDLINLIIIQQPKLRTGTMLSTTHSTYDQQHAVCASEISLHRTALHIARGHPPISAAWGATWGLHDPCCNRPSCSSDSYVSVRAIGPLWVSWFVTAEILSLYVILGVTENTYTWKSFIHTRHCSLGGSPGATNSRHVFSTDFSL